jgi:NAD(P)H-dependent flavin oxidoreductase YrpB (nitropropane dioxygenase family)
VSLAWGDPYADRVHDAGALVLHTVASAQEARRPVAAGVDVIVALGGRRAAGRPGEGEQIARGPAGHPVVRYSSALPLAGTTGDIEALSLWAGQSVALAKRTQPAAEIVAELTSRLPARG